MVVLSQKSIKRAVFALVQKLSVCIRLGDPEVVSEHVVE